MFFLAGIYSLLLHEMLHFYIDFTALERASTPILGHTKIDNIKFNKLLGEVTAHLSTALYAVEDLHTNNSDFCSKIDKCIDSLNCQSINNIDKCIDQAWIAFKEIDLYV